MTQASLKYSGPGDQRLSLDRLRRWESLGYGMFLHFGMATFDGDELSKGDRPASVYQPEDLDVDQWICVARDAGMKYALLTAKHVSGFCLWPSKHTDYHVGHSSVTTDVVEAFVHACDKRGVKPGIYYCSFDNRHRFGSLTHTFCNHAAGHQAFTTQAYRDFQKAQIAELLTNYGPLEEFWVDIPPVLGHDGRIEQYDQIAKLQPDIAIMMNTGIGDGSVLKTEEAWPSDLMAIERFLPNSNTGYSPWFTVSPTGNYSARLGVGRDKTDTVFTPDPPKHYYVPGEVCDPIGYEWFHVDADVPRSRQELLGMRLICKERNTNFLLNVPPDRSGRIPQRAISSLQTLKADFEQCYA